MSEPFIGEIKMFAGTFAPKDYAFAAGQVMPISQNRDLFLVFQTMYGGNGSSTFQLPNLIGNAPMGWGQGPTHNYSGPGQTAGVANVAITTENMTPHTHALRVNFNLGDVNAPSAQACLARASAGNGIYTNETGTVAMASQALPPYAGTKDPLPHNNVQPYIACNFIVALRGVVPVRG